jgi:thiol-disulfide isomerase/thioredoxin
MPDVCLEVAPVSASSDFYTAAAMFHMALWAEKIPVAVATGAARAASDAAGRSIGYIGSAAALTTFLRSVPLTAAVARAGGAPAVAFIAVRPNATADVMEILRRLGSADSVTPTAAESGNAAAEAQWEWTWRRLAFAADIPIVVVPADVIAEAYAAAALAVTPSVATAADELLASLIFPGITGALNESSDPATTAPDAAGLTDAQRRDWFTVRYHRIVPATGHATVVVAPPEQQEPLETDASEIAYEAEQRAGLCSGPACLFVKVLVQTTAAVLALPLESTSYHQGYSWTTVAAKPLHQDVMVVDAGATEQQQQQQQQRGTGLASVASMVLQQPVVSTAHLAALLAYQAAVTSTVGAHTTESKMAVVYVGASWCSPCMRVLPSLPFLATANLPLMDAAAPFYDAALAFSPPPTSPPATIAMGGQRAVRVLKVDKDVAPVVGDVFGVRLVPTFVPLLTPPPPPPSNAPPPPHLLCTGGIFGGMALDMTVVRPAIANAKAEVAAAATGTETAAEASGAATATGAAHDAARVLSAALAKVRREVVDRAIGAGSSLGEAMLTEEGLQYSVAHVVRAHVEKWVPLAEAKAAARDGAVAAMFTATDDF